MMMIPIVAVGMMVVDLQDFKVETAITATATARINDHQNHHGIEIMMMSIILILDLIGMIIMSKMVQGVVTTTTFRLLDQNHNIEIMMIQVTHRTDRIEKIVPVELMGCLLHHNIEIMMILILNRIDCIGMMLGQVVAMVVVVADFHLDLHSIEIMMMSILHQVDLIEEKVLDMIVATEATTTAAATAAAAEIINFHLVGL